MEIRTSCRFKQNRTINLIKFIPPLELGAREQEPSRIFVYGAFYTYVYKCGPVHVHAHFEAENSHEAPKASKSLGSPNPQAKLLSRYEFQDFDMFKNHGILSDMGPHGSVCAHIKTGRSPLAQDHFWTPPDQTMAHTNSKMIQQIKKGQRIIKLLPIFWRSHN